MEFISMNHRSFIVLLGLIAADVEGVVAPTCLVDVALACISDFHSYFGNSDYCESLDEAKISKAVVVVLADCVKQSVQGCGFEVKKQIMVQANDAAKTWYGRIETCNTANCEQLSQCASPLVQNAISSPCAGAEAIAEVEECMRNITGPCLSRSMFYRALMYYRQSCRTDCPGSSGSIESALQCHATMEETYNTLLQAIDAENVTVDDPRCQGVISSLSCLQEPLKGCYRATAIIIFLEGLWVPSMRRYCNIDSSFFCSLRDKRCKAKPPKGRKPTQSKKRKCSRNRWWSNPCTKRCRLVRLRGCTKARTYRTRPMCNKGARRISKRKQFRERALCLPTERPAVAKLPFPQAVPAT